MQTAITATQRWLEKAVIGLNLCPFAKAEYVHGRIHYAVSEATDPEQLLADLRRELLALLAADPLARETTLLIHPQVLQDFFDYNEFLNDADALLQELELDGVLQIASFHPAYQFALTSADDMANYTNRSPHPMLHILREASVERAVAAFPQADEIYDRNIAVMQRLSPQAWAKLIS